MFEAPDDNDLNSNKGLLMAKHFVLTNEMLGDDYQYLSPSILDSGKHEEPADWDKDSPMEVEMKREPQVMKQVRCSTLVPKIIGRLL